MKFFKIIVLVILILEAPTSSAQIRIPGKKKDTTTSSSGTTPVKVSPVRINPNRGDNNNAGSGSAASSQSNIRPAISVPAGRKNLLDANTDYVKTPISFMRFEFNDKLRQQGHNPERIYTWKTPNSETRTASGAQILAEVNEMEKELNKRGHTLRDKNTFLNLKIKYNDPGRKIPKQYKFPEQKKMYNINDKVLSNFSFKKGAKRAVTFKAMDLSKNISKGVYLYFGTLSGGGGSEFQGAMDEEGNIDNYANPKNCPLDIVIALPGGEASRTRIDHMVMEISKNPNRSYSDNNDVFTSIPFDFRSKKAVKNYPNSSIDIYGNQPSGNYELYSFTLNITDADKKFPISDRFESDIYYGYIKYYNAQNELIYPADINVPSINNIRLPPVSIPISKSLKVPVVNNSITDPTGVFGMYYDLQNVNANYALQPNGFNPTTESADLSGKISIGVQFYNFFHLLDGDQPKYTKKDLIAADISSNYSKTYAVGGPPRIRRPGSATPSNDMNGYNNFKYKADLLWQSYDKSSGLRNEYSYNSDMKDNLIEQSFLIGPVPCRITAGLKGSMSITRVATMDTLSPGGYKLYTKIEPAAEFGFYATGSVSYSIAYATVVADVKLLQAKMPLEIIACNNIDINSSLRLEALSGKVYFEAGVCIPIPFYDDLCKSFTFNIFDWTGVGETYSIIP